MLAIKDLSNIFLEKKKNSTAIIHFVSDLAASESLRSVKGKCNLLRLADPGGFLPVLVSELTEQAVSILYHCRPLPAPGSFLPPSREQL